MYLYGTGRVNEQGHLEVGGKDTVALAEKYGTPLYVYDVALIRERARGFKDTFRRLGVSSQVAYASKAFSSIAMIQLAEEEGLSLDVVSAGELPTGAAAAVGIVSGIYSLGFFPYLFASAWLSVHIHTRSSMP